MGVDPWWRSDVTVTLTSGDGLSGVGVVQYSFDGSTWTSYSGSFIISTEGASTLYHRVFDKAGNMYELSSQTIMIDKTPPVITITAPESYGVYPATSGNYQFSATDNLSLKPITCTEIDYDGNQRNVASGDALPSTSGVYTLAVTAMDDAGNMATQSVMFVVYDPSAGFATGGGWIIPESNGYHANFGFVAKYKKGSTLPDGNLEFQYQYRDKPEKHLD